jgi:hypothetical protein
LSENTFRFHLKVLLEKHGGLFESMIARIGRENVLENLCVIYQELEPLSCIITGGPAPILRSVNEVKPKTWRIFRQNDAISMTTLTLFSW